MVFHRQNPAGDLCGRLDHQPSDFAFQLRQHPRVVLRGGVARLGDDLFGGGDGFLRFLLLHARCGRAGFFDQLVGLKIGLIQDFLSRGFGPGQFLFDPIRVGQTFRDALAAFLEHGQDRVVSKFVKGKRDDAEADALRDEMGRIEAELIGDIGERIRNYYG